jgi:hypothetical protein
MVPDPSIDATIKASIIMGNAISASMALMIIVNTHLPKYPAARPSTLPNMPATVIATIPIIKEVREPYIIRVKISLPRVSVPNQCSALGARSVVLSDVSYGSHGVSTGAKIATRIISRTITTPKATTPLPRKILRKRRVSLIRTGGVSLIADISVSKVSPS